MDKTTILVVDDDPKITHLVREVLIATGYEVQTACNGEHALQVAAMEQPDLILLDILLPGSFDGYEVARRVREFSDVPIIMLTAKVKENDLLTGFEAGADDYLTKPFNCKELLVRMRAVLKRTHPSPEAPAKSREVVCSGLEIDFARRKVNVRGQEIHLTPIEYRLLYELATHCNQVLLHEQLLTAVWGQEYRNDSDYLRAYIHHLRQKIEEDPENPKIIVRYPGVGYMLVE
jgi:DNA-binding response OmpR family regulator